MSVQMTFYVKTSVYHLMHGVAAKEVCFGCSSLLPAVTCFMALLRSQWLANHPISNQLLLKNKLIYQGPRLQKMQHRISWSDTVRFQDPLANWQLTAQDYKPVRKNLQHFHGNVFQFHSERKLL